MARSLLCGVQLGGQQQAAPSRRDIKSGRLSFRCISEAGTGDDHAAKAHTHFFAERSSVASSRRPQSASAESPRASPRRYTP